MPAPHQMTRPLRALRSGIILSIVLASSLHAQQQPPVLVHMSHFSPHQVRVEVFSVATPQNVRLNVTGADERFPQHGKLAILERVFGGSATTGDGEDAWRGNAWIINAATRNPVWELRNASTRRDRDGVRVFDGTVHLDPGTYEIYFASYSSYSSTVNIRSPEHLTPAQIAARTHYEDDGISRKFELTVRGSGQTLPANAYIADVEAARHNAFISLTGLHANESRTAGFELDKPARVDVHAIGEIRETETFDYGWIINADTHEKVWGLDFSDSHPAGGARKNREAFAHLTLPPGRYAAIYTLDDSHDLADWNAAPPHDPALWGMTVRLADPADRSHVKMFDYSSKAANAIVAMTGLGDGESRSQGFTISHPMNVHVFALGEGDRDDMRDYGWITDAKTHQRVWTMQYNNSQHAGGSQKNRVASQVVHLEPGSYIAGFRTDESHSAKGWNAGAPIEGSMWGISIWPDKAADRNAVSAYDPSRDDGVVVAKLVNMSDDEDARSTFRVDKPGAYRVYAIGEGRDNQMFDRGIIEERGTHRVIWQMNYDKTVPAGGASKNRLFDGTVQLPAGDYVLRWTSDDSHSYNNWNDAAPEDPSHWGITLYRASGK